MFRTTEKWYLNKTVIGIYECSEQRRNNTLTKLLLVQWNLCNPTPEFSDILWHPTKMYGPKIFLWTKIKPEYFDILYNPTHFPGPLVCRIRQVSLYIWVLRTTEKWYLNKAVIGIYECSEQRRNDTLTKLLLVYTSAPKNGEIIPEQNCYYVIGQWRSLR